MEDKELAKYFQIIKQKFLELEERIKKLEERKSKERPHAIPTEKLKEEKILDYNYYAKRKEEDVQTEREYNTTTTRDDHEEDRLGGSEETNRQND